MFVLVLKFIESLTEESLKALREDIKKFLGEFEALKEKEKEEKKSSAPKISLSALFGGKKKTEEKKKKLSFFEKMELEWVRQKANAKARSSLFTIYDVFKKAHRELSFPDEPAFKPKEKPL